MKSEAHEFLESLKALPPNLYEYHFSTLLEELGLADCFDRNELILLCEAAIRASLCQRAFNELENRVGNYNQEPEANRVQLEREFMAARDVFYGSPGWQNLEESSQAIIEKAFFSIEVEEKCLAW
jgi:hypothetical protein